MKKSLETRDNLAFQRTDLAIDRTLLAYLRSALAIVVVGVSLIKFIAIPVSIITGWALIFLAIVLQVYGLFKCNTLRLKNSLNRKI